MRPRLRGLILPAILTLAALVVLVSLGNWQVERLAWKQDLIARVEERPLAEPVDFRRDGLDFAADESFFEEFEYRKALITGRYDPAGEVLVFTSLSDARGPLSGIGYWVFTPLLTSPGGRIVYVNRGFVPEERKRDYAAPAAGEVTVRGRIRAAETGSWFTPEPNLQERIFFARDPRIVAAATGLANAQGFFIDLEAAEAPPGGLPQAGETRTVFTNNHLGYAVTWYGLAAALLLVFLSFAWTRLRGRAEEPRLTPPGGAP
jgi:surfeit locus 1 family protein